MIELRGISKAFGGVAANADISFRAEAGSIHAIVGENGAGKSTAMKILYGIYRPDAGEIRLDGQARRWRDPSDAIAAGIGMVHQHFMLAGPYTALENILVGAEPAKAGWKWLPRALRPVDRAGARAKLEALSRQYGLDAPLDEPVENLPVGVQQRIEILKALYRDARVLILDEPTAVLTPQEISELFANLRKLAGQGRTILIITHKLKEVMAISDRVTVFRAGKVVGEVETSKTSPPELAAMMVGRKVALSVEAPPASEPGAPVLEVKGLSLRPRPDAGSARHRLEGLDLEVRAGEIVGIAGVEGNGQSDLLHLLTDPQAFARGEHGGVSGSVRCLGRETLVTGAGGGAARATLGTGAIKALGMGIIPEDRHREGLLLERPVRENFLLGQQRRAEYRRGRWIAARSLETAAGRAIEEYDVRPRSLDALAGRLSGGNQQKVIIAREMGPKPRFIIAAQPTRGVDVGAIEFIHRRLLEARAGGAGILLVSSELDEVMSLSDRILVMYEGKIVARFGRGEAGEERLGLYMGGGHE